jgi:hypothetical protein
VHGIYPIHPAENEQVGRSGLASLYTGAGRDFNARILTQTSRGTERPSWQKKNVKNFVLCIDYFYFGANDYDPRFFDNSHKSVANRINAFLDGS